MSELFEIRAENNEDLSKIPDLIERGRGDSLDMFRRLLGSRYTIHRLADSLRITAENRSRVISYVDNEVYKYMGAAGLPPTKRIVD